MRKCDNLTKTSLLSLVDYKPHNPLQVVAGEKLHAAFTFIDWRGRGGKREAEWGAAAALQ